MALDAPRRQSPPEFLLKLSKILQTEDQAIIAWENGHIRVKDPHRLAKTVLSKYFRHSKFSSFQRQLNYFGFHKTEGKGKHAPCVYTNDALAGASINDLLSIKRKTSTQPNRGSGNVSFVAGVGGGYTTSPTSDFSGSPTFEEYSQNWGQIVMYEHQAQKRNRDVMREQPEFSVALPMLSESAPAATYEFGDLGMEQPYHMLKKTKSMNSMFENMPEAMTRQAGQVTMINHDMTPATFFARPRPHPVDCGTRFGSQSCPPTSSRMAMRSMSDPFGGFDSNSAFSIASQSSTNFSFAGCDDFQPNTATSAESNDQASMFGMNSPVAPLMDPLAMDGGCIDYFQEEDPSFDQLFACLLDDDLDL